MEVMCDGSSTPSLVAVRASLLFRPEAKIKNVRRAAPVCQRAASLIDSRHWGGFLTPGYYTVYHMGHGSL